MKIWHKVSFPNEDAIRRRLDEIEIEYSTNVIAFDIDEGDPRWPAVKLLVDGRVICDICTTKFTARELEAASWLTMSSTWHHGYPMPDDDFGYRNETYDLTDYCSECGMGAQQKAPFRIRGEPRWGSKSIFSLNWVFDEFFVIADAWKSVFKPLGFESWPVLAHRTGRTLKTVMQLRVDAILSDAIDMGDHPSEECPECTRIKYSPFTRGMFPAIQGHPDLSHAVKTKEWFGSGASARRGLLVSGDVYRAIADEKLKGVAFVPVTE
jgi:hypothetical protein